MARSYVEDLKSAPRILIRYKRANGTQEDWHRDIAGFIAETAR
ncbi:MAG: hypothetical protein ACREVG_14450 [Burkholderiales bacterium]